MSDRGLHAPGPSRDVFANEKAGFAHDADAWLQDMLTVAGLACARGGITLLAGLSFRVAAGQALVLRGPNGLGKTTLLRTLAGLQPPVAGQVDGPEPAFAGHADAVKPTLTVAENLRFWADVQGVQGIDAALAALDLRGLADRRALELSAGQRRRLGLARLAVSGRNLWLLDEPTVSLDTASVARFGAMLAAHLAAGGAAVIATHIDVGLAADVLDLTPFRVRAAASADPFARPVEA